jgi:hypothetical protein
MIEEVRQRVGRRELPDGREDGDFGGRRSSSRRTMSRMIEGKTRSAMRDARRSRVQQVERREKGEAEDESKDLWPSGLDE